MNDAHRGVDLGVSTIRRLAGIVAVALISAGPVGVFPVPQVQAAAPVLTVTPLTWNVIGLDSNTPATGPNRFPVGTRVCNEVGGATATNVSAVFSWDSANSFVNLRPGSLDTIVLGSIPAGTCADAYFEVEVSKTTSAFDTTRRYHVTATDAGSGASATSPQPREMYVEHLISQNRNGVTAVKLNGTTIPAGGAMTLVVGNTYTIELDGYTATQGYNQLEAFINFPNTIFRTVAVASTFTADTSPYLSAPLDKLYSDACLWDSDPNSPNYRSCIGDDGKAGGTVTTIYTVKILSGAGTSENLNSLLYDFSGSSYHYNADYSVGGVIAQIVSPASVTISKAFVPKAIAPGGTSTLTLRLTNPTGDTFTGVNFTDPLPAGVTVAGTPATSYSGCGAGAFSPAPVAGATSLAFANGTLLPNGMCTITVQVTAPAGVYPNTTDHLFINTSTDTGNIGQDTLTASSAPACIAGQTLAAWTVPTGTVANPPDNLGGLPTTKAANVATALAVANVPADTAITAASGHADTTSWQTWGYKNAGQYIQFQVDTSAYTGVSMRFWVANPGGANGPNNLVASYSTGGAFTTLPTNLVPGTVFTEVTVDLTGLTSTTGVTTFRLTGTGANNDNNAANLDYDDISFTGCGAPAPAPTIAKSFSPKPIVQGATSTLTFTIANTAPGNQTLTGVTFSDVLPTGLSILDSTSTKCTVGTLTTTAATRSITLTGGTIAAGATCTFNVNVTGTTAGNYDNVTGFIASTESGVSTNYATDSLMVVAPPAIAKSFSPSAIMTGANSTLAFVLTNPNQQTALTGLQFTDTLPAGVTVANTGPTAICGGSLTTTSPDAISFTGGTLAAAATCTLSVATTGATTGTKLNTTNAISSTEGGAGNSAQATLLVNDPFVEIDLNKQVSADNANWFKFVGAPAGDPVFYRFSIYNGGQVPFTAISVDDPTLAGGPSDPATCIFTTPLAPGATTSCVTGPIASVLGLHPNTATASGTYASGTASSAPSTATYATPGLSIDKSAAESYFSAAGDVLHYSYLVTNSGFTPLLGPVTVADDKSADETCPAVTTVGDLDNYLDASESIACTATYTVQPGDVSGASVTNTASATADGVTSPDDSVTVPLQSPSITLAKSALPTVVSAVGQVVSYSFLVTNTGNVTLTSVGVSDPLAGLSAISCPGTVLAPAASMTCTATYTVTQSNLNNGLISNTATGSGTPPSGPPVTDTDSVNVTATSTPQLNIVKATSATSYNAVGQVLNFTLTITNTGDVTLSNVLVSDASAAVGVCTPTMPTTMAPGDQSVCSAAHAVTQSDIDHGSYDNVALASGTPPRGQPFTVASNTVTVPAARNAAVAVVKATNVTNFSSVGQLIAYTITATNVGNVTMTGVTISDPNAQMGLCAPIAPARLAPGESLTCAAVHTVTQADVNAGRIVNTARVDGDIGQIPITLASNTVVLVSATPLLPATGSDSSLLLTWASCCVGVGGVALLASMRRRRVRSIPSI